MKYLLDTDTCIYFLNGNKKLIDKIEQVPIDSLNISFISVSELFFGAYNSSNIKNNIDKVNQFTKLINVVRSDLKSENLFGKIKANLKIKGKIIEDFDIFIASIAIENDLILVTNNTSHYSRIEDIKLQNWILD
jgi:tRNA(fMet)-specific endonuclease VapC